MFLFIKLRSYVELGVSYMCVLMQKVFSFVLFPLKYLLNYYIYFTEYLVLNMCGKLVQADHCNRVHWEKQKKSIKIEPQCDSKYDVLLDGVKMFK